MRYPLIELFEKMYHGKLQSLVWDAMLVHRGPTQCVCIADCYYIVNALDLPFASPIAIYR